LRVIALLSLYSLPVAASDHADPINLEELEGGITDLFVYPKDDQLIVIFGVRRALSQPAPYQLSAYTYSIYMDLHTGVSVDRATLKEKSFKGLTNPEAIRMYVGVRDDPFIFLRSFGTNIIAALPRFDFLNTLPPARHAAAIKARHEDPDILQDFLRVKLT
jgi:hypothetical protein